MIVLYCRRPQTKKAAR